jgi:predicted nucleotidyltransferase
MGSVAYGCSGGSSDMDLYGWCIPPKEYLFPHLAGNIRGFGREPQDFTCWQQHHVDDKQHDKQYDFAIYGVARFVDLVMQNNPNMLDSLFVPTRCVIHSTSLSEIFRDNRKLFLHKGCWHKFKGYAYQQVHKMSIKQPKEGSKRHANVQEFGFDVKFAYHVVRLMLEVEQILAEGDLVLDRNSEVLKAIRRGEWTEERIKEYFSEKEKSLEVLYNESKLPYGPDEEKIKGLLLNVLEQHYGSLKEMVSSIDVDRKALMEIRDVLSRNGIC